MTKGLPGEERLVLWANRHAYESRLRPRLHALETAVPYGGAALLYCLLGLLALRRIDDRSPALRAMAAGVAAWILSDLLKLLVERPRPCLHQLSCGTHSFPEGPGMVFAAVAVAIWPTSRGITAVAVVCALVDGAVQLGYGSHWPSDLLGAWVLGGLCGFAVPRVAARLVRASAGE
ncbi:MAG TPA: phosphatase PAP2 family protein [Gaiellales bacterium]|jgi:undecaprenyl-diphosphatase|nr:phosphatase PAP2 family protein [Gaiellales bacterium]